MVREQMPLIEEIQTDGYWQDVTTPMLETARKRLRALVKLIEKAKRKSVYTDFEDLLGDETTVNLPGFGTTTDFERFRAKERQFLKAHENHVTIHKLRWNKALTATDLDELERMLIKAGVGTTEDLSRAKQQSQGLGLFIYSTVILPSPFERLRRSLWSQGRGIAGYKPHPARNPLGPPLFPS